MNTVIHTVSALFQKNTKSSFHSEFWQMNTEVRVHATKTDHYLFLSMLTKSSNIAISILSDFLHVEWKEG